MTSSITASTLKIHGVAAYPRKASPVGDRFRKPNLAAQLTAAGAVNVRSPATIPIRTETRSVVESMACIVNLPGGRLAAAPATRPECRRPSGIFVCVGPEKILDCAPERHHVDVWDSFAVGAGPPTHAWYRRACRNLVRPIL